MEGQNHKNVFKFIRTILSKENWSIPFMVLINNKITKKNDWECGRVYTVLEWIRM